MKFVLSNSVIGLASITPAFTSISNSFVNSISANDELAKYINTSSDVKITYLKLTTNHGDLDKNLKQLMKAINDTTNTLIKQTDKNENINLLELSGIKHGIYEISAGLKAVSKSITNMITGIPSNYSSTPNDVGKSLQSLSKSNANLNIAIAKLRSVSGAIIAKGFSATGADNNIKKNSKSLFNLADTISYISKKLDSDSASKLESIIHGLSDFGQSEANLVTVIRRLTKN